MWEIGVFCSVPSIKQLPDIGNGKHLFIKMWV